MRQPRPGVSGWMRALHARWPVAALRCCRAVYSRCVGDFHRGDLVEIVDDADLPVARGLCQYGATEARRLAGRHSRDIEQVLGYSYGAEVVHRDDLAALAHAETAGARNA